MKRAVLPAALLGVLVTTPLYATGGYFSGTKGARPGGRAGAFTAKADDLTAVTFNPAGLVHDDGTLLELSNRISYNAYEYTRAPTLDLSDDPPPLVSFKTVRNEKPWQGLDPLLGAASDLGLRDWRFALVAFAPAGMSRLSFPVDGGQKYMMVSRDAIILNYTATAAWKYKELVGLGASFQWIHVPRLWYSLVIDANTFGGSANPVTAPLDMLATTKGSSAFTPNAVIGGWYRPAPFLEIGVAGQVIPANVKTQSTLSIEPLDPELEAEGVQVQLRRNGQAANDVTVTLPLPVSARAGVRYRHLDGVREVFDIELDVAYESWSRVENFTLESNGMEGEMTGRLMGNILPIGRIDIEKEWQDSFSVHLGGDFAVLPNRLTGRAGFFYESPVAKPAYANVDFVAGPQLGGTLGWSAMFGRFELAISYEHRIQTPVRVAEKDGRVYQEVPGSQCEAPYTDAGNCHPALLGQPSPTVNAGTYRAHSNAASLDVLYRF